MISNQTMFYNQKHDEYPTPTWLFRTFDILEGKFDLDVAATIENKKCLKFYGLGWFDGLTQPWHKHGKKVWCNPPYTKGAIPKWINKAIEESKLGCRVVMLLPAYTDKRWFLSLVLPNAKKIYFVEGRVKFKGAPQSAPFASMAVVFDSKIKSQAPELIPLRRAKWVSSSPS